MAGLDPVSKPTGTETRNPVGQANEVKQKIKRGVIDNVYTLCAIMLIVLPCIVFLTDISLSDIRAITEISLSLFILWFCSFGMYVNCSEAGIKAGSKENIYTTAIAEFKKLKDGVKNNDNIMRAAEFCEWYKRNELEQTRKGILVEAGIRYIDYLKHYIGKSKKDLESCELTKTQIKAIVNANNLKMVELTPERMFKRGRGSGSRRNPLSTTPERKRGIHKTFRVISTFLTSGLTCFIVFDVIANPTFATVAVVCFKLLTIGMSAVRGYSMGYTNIVEDTTNYVNDQSDLIVQLNKYIEKYPQPQAFDEEDEEVNAPDTDDVEETPEEES